MPTRKTSLPCLLLTALLAVPVLTLGWSFGTENRGQVELNAAGDGVVLTAHAGGTPGAPGGRTPIKDCSVFAPALRFQHSDVFRETAVQQSDLDALRKRGEGEDQQILVRRNCRVPVESGNSNQAADQNGGTATGEQRWRLQQESRWVTLRRLVGDMARTAVNTLTFPLTRAQFSPPARTRTLVGVDTWFWVPATSWMPITRVVGTPPVVVVAIARPTSLRFTPGDGSRPVICPGPGLPWRPGGSTLCRHVYQQASTQRSTGRYSGVVSTIWMVSWTSTTGASGTIGPIPRAQRVSLKVAEAEAVLGT